MRGRKATIMALIAAAGILLLVGVNVYQNFYQPYATLTVTQLEPAFLPPPPPGMEYARMPDSVYDEFPKIRSVFAEVHNKYRDVLSNCPPQRPVYCDIAAGTETSTTVTAAELESILKSKDLNFYVAKVEAEWTAYVKRDCLVPQVTLEECYYTIKLSRIY